MNDGEARILRERTEELAERIDRFGVADHSDTYQLFQVYQQVTIPTTTPKYFACHPVILGGTEQEGGTPAFVPDTAQTVFVDVLGPAAPIAGDYLIGSLVGGRWVAATKGTPSNPYCGGIIGYVKGCLGITSPFGSNGLTGATVTGGTGGALTATTVTSGGAGYTSAPSAAVGGDGVSGALSVRMTGSVTSASVGSAGRGYTAAPTVTIAAPALPGGVTATATANMTGSGSIQTVASVTITGGGSGYDANPTISFSAPPSAVTATGTAVLDGSGGIASITMTNNGTAYSSGAPTINISGGGGSGATATCTVSGGSVTGSPTITHIGTGYTSIPTVTFGTPPFSFAATGTTSRGSSLSVYDLTITNGGVGYSTAPITFSGGAGSGAAATATLSSLTTVGTCTTKAGSVTAATKTNGGSGYTPGKYALGFTGANTTPAVGFFDVTVNTVNHVVITDGGSGYASAPTISFPGAGGSGAVATATIGTACVIPYTAGGNFWARGSCTGWTDKTVNNTLTCNSNTQIQIAPTVATGYHCPTSTATVCNEVFPDSSFVTDSNGSHAMTFSTFGSGIWAGCYVDSNGTAITYTLHTNTGAVLDISWTAWGFGNSDLGHACNAPGGVPCPGSCGSSPFFTPQTQYVSGHGACNNNPGEVGIAQGVSTVSVSPISTNCGDCSSSPSITFTLPSTFTSVGHTYTLPVSGTVTFTP